VDLLGLESDEYGIAPANQEIAICQIRNLADRRANPRRGSIYNRGHTFHATYDHLLLDTRRHAFTTENLAFEQNRTAAAHLDRRYEKRSTENIYNNKHGGRRTNKFAMVILKLIAVDGECCSLPIQGH
jgi:hypothetical protein